MPLGHEAMSQPPACNITFAEQISLSNAGMKRTSSLVQMWVNTMCRSLQVLLIHVALLKFGKQRQAVLLKPAVIAFCRQIRLASAGQGVYQWRCFSVHGGGFPHPGAGYSVPREH